MIANMTKFNRLESKRTIFLEAGMILSLVIVLCAFNWKTYNKSTFTGLYRPVDNTPVEMVPVTIQKPPEPPKINRPVVVYSINIVDNADPVDEDYIINAEADPMDSVTFYVGLPVIQAEEPPVDEQEIFRVVESMPEFPCGFEALHEYLSKNIIYPELAKSAGISGKVFLYLLF